MATTPNIRQIEDGIIAPSVAPVVGQVPVATGIGNETEWQDASQISGKIAFSARWTYALSTTIVDPSPGNLRTNAAPELSTIMAISVEDGSGADAVTILDTLSEGDLIVVQDDADPSNWVKYSLDGAVVDNTTWYQIPVTVMETGGTLVKGAETFVRFAYGSESGISGIDIAQDGVVQAAGATEIDFLTNFVVSPTGEVSHNPQAAMSFNQNIPVNFGAGGTIASIAENALHVRHDDTVLIGADGGPDLVLENITADLYMNSNITLGVLHADWDGADTTVALQHNGSDVLVVAEALQGSGGTPQIPADTRMEFNAAGNGHIEYRTTNNDFVFVSDIAGGVDHGISVGGDDVVGGVKIGGIGTGTQASLVRFSSTQVQFAAHASASSRFEISPVAATNEVRIRTGSSNGLGVFQSISSGIWRFESNQPGQVPQFYNVFQIGDGTTNGDRKIGYFNKSPVAQPVLTSGTQQELTAALGSTSGLGLVDDSAAAAWVPVVTTPEVVDSNNSNSYAPVNPQRKVTYLIDTLTDGAQTTHMQPDDWEPGDIIRFVDYESNFSSDSFTIDFESHNFEGTGSATLVMSVDDGAITLEYIDATRGFQRISVV
jgi:hypothetical protein